MNSVLQYLIIAILFNLASHHVSSTQVQQIHIGIGLNGPYEMTISWATENGDAKMVQYGVQPGSYPYNVTSTVHRYTCPADQVLSPFLHEVTLVGLDANTTYYYRVGNDTTDAWTNDHSFTTDPEETELSEAYIVAFGDVGTVPRAQTTINKISQSVMKPTLLIHAGDFSYANGNSPIWDDFFRMIEPVASTVPYMPAVGNHEGEYNENFVAYTNRFAINNRFWYSFNRGPVHIICLSSEHDYSVGSEQYNWLVSDLINAQNDKKNRPWIFVVAHRPPFNSNQYGSNMALRDVLQPLMQSYNVDIGIFGHEHSYERSYPLMNSKPITTNKGNSLQNAYVHLNGTPIWTVVGIGGYGLRNARWNEKPDWSAHREAQDAGYVGIHVKGYDLRWTFYRNDGAIPDEFYIRKEPDGTDTTSATSTTDSVISTTDSIRISYVDAAQESRSSTQLVAVAIVGSLLALVVAVVAVGLVRYRSHRSAQFQAM